MIGFWGIWRIGRGKSARSSHATVEKRSELWACRFGGLSGLLRAAWKQKKRPRTSVAF